MLSFIAVKDKGKLKTEKQYLRLSMINEAERILALRIYQKYDRSLRFLFFITEPLINRQDKMLRMKSAAIANLRRRSVTSQTYAEK